MRTVLRRVAVVLPAAAATVAAGMFAPSAQPSYADVPDPEPGWTLTWSDDFEQPEGTLPSSENWIIDEGHGYPGGPDNWGTGEIQRYTSDPANVSHDGQGNLRITPLRSDSGEWTSARIETQRTDFKAPDGGILRIEGRIQMPNVTGDAALGYWPAFWALGSPYRGDYQNWPGIGEFDVMENVNGLDTVWGVLHCGVAPGGPCDESNGIGAARACPGSPCQGNFHTYRFEWDRSTSPEQLRWYVDGEHYHTVTQDQVGEPYWSNMTDHAGYFILLNVAMGGGFPDGVAGFATPTAATEPGHPMLVDYVAVYTWDGDGSTPPGEGGSAYATIEAESFSAQSGVQTEPCSEGGSNLGSIADGDWVRFDGLDFGDTPARTFVARVASGAPAGVSGLVQVRLDDLSAQVVGDFAIADTGGWQSWRTVRGNVSGITGVHDVFLTFSSGQPQEFVNLNWFTFET